MITCVIIVVTVIAIIISENIIIIAAQITIIGVGCIAVIAFRHNIFTFIRNLYLK